MIRPDGLNWKNNMAAQTYLFPCLKDNFGVLIHDPASGATAAIDAPEAAPVEAALKKTGWRLSDILVTHHHADHTQCIGEIKSHHQCRVVAPLAEAERRDFWEICEDRYQTRSTILTSQLPVARWHEQIGDPSVADNKGPQNPQYIQNDPHDAYQLFDESLQSAWIHYLMTRYGNGNQGGVAIWALDTEPTWWDNTHGGIHPTP